MFGISKRVPGLSYGVVCVIQLISHVICTLSALRSCGIFRHVAAKTTQRASRMAPCCTVSGVNAALVYLTHSVGQVSHAASTTGGSAIHELSLPRPSSTREYLARSRHVPSTGRLAR